MLVAGGQSQLLGREATAAAAWYAVAGKTCVRAYQPKGAADLATSYVNLISPGTGNAAPGSAPTFNAATGWTNASNKYLTTGFVPATGCTIAIRFSGVTNGGALCGVINVATDTGIAIFPNLNGDQVYFYAPGANAKTPQLTSGVLIVAGNTLYRNGAADKTAAGTWPTLTRGLYLFAYAAESNGAATSACACSIQAFAAYTDTLDATEAATLAAAMAAL